MTKSLYVRLKKCPCCGSKSVGVHHRSCYHNDYNHVVMCSECGLTTREFSSEVDAIIAWNKRVK